MDYIREFDIRLEKEMYYAGETLSGHVMLNTTENFKLRTIRVLLRGKAHAEWKVVVSGDRRTVQDDQIYIDDRSVIWGTDKTDCSVPILPRGQHAFAFRFQLPESSLPCSFESRTCTIRYYVKVTLDIPYASTPQGMKYFTLVGPHIDCMDEQYLKPLVGQDKRSICCLCCKKGMVSLRCALERSAYCCGESIRLKADIDNQSEENLRLQLKVVQYVESFIDRGVLGLSKDSSHNVLEFRGDKVKCGSRHKFDSSTSLVVPIMPPTLTGVCRLLQIYYVLKVWVELEKSGDELHMNFPLTIATCPFRIPNSTQQPQLDYDVCCDHVEGGLYIGPEFQLGQVYDGTLGIEEGDHVVLYRPVYVCVRNPNRVQHQKSQESVNKAKRVKEIKETLAKEAKEVAGSKESAQLRKKSSTEQEQLPMKEAKKVSKSTSKDDGDKVTSRSVAKEEGTKVSSKSTAKEEVKEVKTAKLDPLAKQTTGTSEEKEPEKEEEKPEVSQPLLPVI